MAKIRVDQSHCNYYLAQWLEAEKWKLLFTDAGRVSRGGTGSQGKCLRIFEVNGLPIPDIVALSNNGCLLIIEIDTAFRKAQQSLDIYRQSDKLILNELNYRLSLSAEYLATGFCKTELTKNVKSFDNMQENSNNIDLWVVFGKPRKPTLYWIKTVCVEK